MCLLRAQAAGVNVDNGVVLRTAVVDQCKATLRTFRLMADEIAVLDCNAPESGQFDAGKELWCGIVWKLASTSVVQETPPFWSGMQWT